MQKNIRQLIAELPPKQQSLPFQRDIASPTWQAFRHEDQQACRAALSRLFVQVIQTNRKAKDDE